MTYRIHLRELVRLLLFASFSNALFGLAEANNLPQNPLNVLFIAVDDLRPELGCYGANHVVSPNIDRFARTGIVFKRAYCQQSVCNPSRTSLMTGLRPDTIGVVGNHMHFRTNMPDVVTLPQHFRQHGYHAQAIGKIYHGVFPDGASSTTWDTMGDPPSWSIPAMRFGPRYYYTEEGITAAKQIFQKIYKPENPGPDDWTEKLVFGPATESPNVSDSTLYDGQVADSAVAALGELRNSDQPFFLAVGFIKPHSPYIAPKKYFDLYNDVSLPSHENYPTDAPKHASHGSHELRRYTDQPKQGAFSDEGQRRVRHAYFACVSYIDAQIGRVLDELDRQGMRENTIVCLFGDHGYHLGEQGLWGKTTNFELDTRVPLIVRHPGMKAAGRSSRSIVELVDLYPTLSELVGLPPRKELEGESFAVLLDTPDAATDQVAISQYPRGDLMGYSLRTPTHRLTQWRSTQSREIQATELYEYSKGLIEKENIANRPENSQVLAQLSAQLQTATQAVYTAITDQPAPEISVAKPIASRRPHGTSFEDVEAGKFRSIKTEIGTWEFDPKNSEGLVQIESRHAKSGSQCLQLAGENAVVTLTRSKQAKANGQLKFWAERWTVREPFTFRIDRQTKDGWQEIYNGDETVKVGRSFRSQIAIRLGSKEDGELTKLRFRCTSPANKGILIDDVVLVAAKQQKVTAVELVPVTLPALIGNPKTAILKLKIATIGSLAPVSLTELAVRLTGTTDIDDIASLELHYSEGASEFKSISRLGKSLAPGVATDTTLTFVGSQSLSEGDNFFWVACRLKDSANVDNRIGVAIDRLELSTGQKISVDTTSSIQRMGIAVRRGGDDGVHTFRIPGLATTNQGSLIGVYDLRRDGGRDLPGNIDVGMSRSTDGGRTWEPMKVIMDMGEDPNFNHDGIGDPSVMVDRTTGTVWVGATWSHGDRSWIGSGPGLEPADTGQFMLVKSDDDGVSWSQPINITKQVKKPAWSFLLQGPGKGITMSDGTIVFPAQYQDPPNADDKTANRLPHSTFIYSRNHGESWQIATGAWDDTTEAQVVELADGEIMINCRFNRTPRRAIMTTKNMGETWQKHTTHLDGLIEPGACMASVINVGRELKWQDLAGFDNDFLLFSNPDSLRGRNHLTIKASKDAGTSWPSGHHLLLDEQNGRGYSCMSMIDAETVGILYEGSQADMTFQRVKIADILTPPVDQKTKNPALSIHLPTGTSAKSELALARVFSDHMVLQANQPIRVWGTAPPKTAINVTFGEQSVASVANEQGSWLANLESLPPNATPQTLMLSDGNRSVVIRDVLVGEVWFCAGQSNMEWPLDKSALGAEAIKHSYDAALRLLSFSGGPRGDAGVYETEMLRRLEPEKFSEGRWQVSGPDSSATFSAVGFYFAKRLRKELHCPVGIIDVSIGGTPIESWIGQAELRADPKLATLCNGNWLENSQLDDWCRDRARSNLKRALDEGQLIPSDPFGPHHSFKPGFMYAAGVVPFTPMSLRGVLWYQGESNADNLARARIYDRAFPRLVRSWRSAFRNPEMPVAFVQLPAMGRPNWPVFREYQRRSLGRLKNVGMAITIDTGHATNVHPAAKAPVGNRLAQWVLRETYQKDVGPATGPLFQSYAVEHEKLRIRFLSVGEELRTCDSNLPRHFEIAGFDGVFHAAKATIEDDSVVLTSSSVSQPRDARYAWSDFPTPPVNLVNAIGLPASPFTTETDF